MPLSRSVLLCAAALLVTAAHAQTLSFEPMPLTRTLVEVNLIHGFYGNADLNSAAGLGVIGLHANVVVGPRTNLDILLPITSAGSSRYLYGSSASTQIGNIGAALQASLDDARHSVLTFGVEAPTAPKDYLSVIFPLISNWTNLDRYVPQAFTLRAGYQGRYVAPSGFFIGGQIQPRVLIPTGTASGEAMWVGDFGATAGYETQSAGVIMELENLANLSNSDADLFSALALGGEIKGDNMRGTLYVQLPLNKAWSDMVSPILGLKFGFAL